MANSNSKNNPIVITDSSGKRRTVQIVTLIGSNGELIDLTDGSINVTDKGYVSDENSSSTPLAGNDTFYGSSIDMLQSTVFAKLAFMYALIKFIEFISKKSKDNGNN